jgi:hypothetical protein
MTIFILPAFLEWRCPKGRGGLGLLCFSCHYKLYLLPFEEEEVFIVFLIIFSNIRKSY